MQRDLTDEQIDAIADAHRWDTREGRRALVRAALASAPAADGWRQYATEREQTAQAVIERHRRELRTTGGMLAAALERAEAAEAMLRAAPAADLTDDQIDACVGNLGMAPYSVLAGPDEIRKFARKLLAERAFHPQAQVVEPAVKQWPFVLSPGLVASLLTDALRNFDGDVLAALRNVFIEQAIALRPVETSQAQVVEQLAREIATTEFGSSAQLIAMGKLRQIFSVQYLTADLPVLAIHGLEARHQEKGGAA